MAGKVKAPKSPSKLRVETIIHDDAKRKNIPTAEYQSILHAEGNAPIRVAYERRNKDLDPQLVWRGKEQENWTDLVVSAPPLFIQEKVHPKVIIDDLLRSNSKTDVSEQIDLFSDFNGLPNEGARTEFYQHDSHWTNRMILGDSLQVMASLAEREGLRGKVQCIYFDPPYGIKFNSNFQWSTATRDVKDGKIEHITREPEQVKAFRDTWKDGIHSYLTYIRDRLQLSRDLLSESGSIFVQIGEENVHRVRALLDEVFGDQNSVTTIIYRKTGGLQSKTLASECDYILWYARDYSKVKYRRLYTDKATGHEARLYSWLQFDDGTIRGMTKSEKEGRTEIPANATVYKPDNPTSQGNTVQEFKYQNKTYKGGWKTTSVGMDRLGKASRIHVAKNSIMYVRKLSDFGVVPVTHLWTDTSTATGSFKEDKIYVVQTSTKAIERCILMTTDPGDLVLDPTCGSGTTAFVAEQFGRRWITVDTSRVALALARGRIMGAKYPYYLLKDSKDGALKEAEVSGVFKNIQDLSFGNSIRQGFVYERVSRVTLGAIANNAEIDTIWNAWEGKIHSLLQELNGLTNSRYEEWELPTEEDPSWSVKAKTLYKKLVEFKKARLSEINSSINSKSENEYLFDKPFVDKSRVRVAGPFTIESVSPHRILIMGEDSSPVLEKGSLPRAFSGTADFVSTILENLKVAGVQQVHKIDKIAFGEIVPWPGEMICAEAKYIEQESGKEKRAAIFIGPEFGTVSRIDLVEAAKEAAESDFEVLIACAFNFDARASEFSSLGKIPVLKARMNAELHMAENLKNTNKGNLFVVFGEPDIEVQKVKEKYKVKINGVDVFHPNTGEVRSDGAEGIACWMIDTDYNEESFFVRHAYFLGANDPYESLRSTLKEEIDESAWESINSDTSRPFEKPASGRIAVKVINHLGDEVMKVFKVN